MAGGRRARRPAAQEPGWPHHFCLICIHRPQTAQGFGVRALGKDGDERGTPGYPCCQGHKPQMANRRSKAATSFPKRPPNDNERQRLGLSWSPDACMPPNCRRRVPPQSFSAREIGFWCVVSHTSLIPPALNAVLHPRDMPYRKDRRYNSFGCHAGPSRHKAFGPQSWDGFSLLFSPCFIALIWLLVPRGLCLKIRHKLRSFWLWLVSNVLPVEVLER